MNCKSFRKYVGAFADGELDVQLNLEALEHLNMCPACARRVTEITECKTALQRIWPIDKAPAQLHTRIANALNEVTLPTSLSTLPDDLTTSTAIKPRWYSYFVKPVAVAAAIVLCVTVWKLAPDNKVQPGTMTVLAARTVADVREQHMQCSAMPMGMHHNKSLSRSLTTIASRLGKRLDLKVLAPDLTSFGYKLVGADACGIRGRAAAHVLYESASGERKLSVYSVNRLADLNPNRSATPSGRRYFVAPIDSALTVIAWHEGLQSYAVCAPLPEDTLLTFFDKIGVASAALDSFNLEQSFPGLMASR